MMIDVAIHLQRDEGYEPQKAIHDAAVVRLRPIMMTTAAAVLGAVPLAIGIGQGASLRQPLGITVMGGLIFSQVFTLYTTPVIYLYLDRLRARLARWSATLAVEQIGRERMNMKIPTRSSAASLALLLGGCMVGPDYHRPQVATPPPIQGAARLDRGGARGRSTEGRLVDRLQRSVARRARTDGVGLQPDRASGLRQLPGRAGRSAGGTQRLVPDHRHQRLGNQAAKRGQQPRRKHGERSADQQCGLARRQCQLGARSVGQGPPHHRGEQGDRAGQRRRPWPTPRCPSRPLWPRPSSNCA